MHLQTQNLAAVLLSHLAELVHLRLRRQLGPEGLVTFLQSRLQRRLLLPHALCQDTAEIQTSSVLQLVRAQRIHKQTLTYIHNTSILIHLKYKQLIQQVPKIAFAMIT